MRDLKLTNYHILGQKGLSTAFTRSFMNHQSANGTLSTVQEMSGGIVKRGLVDVIIDKNGLSQSVFTVSIANWKTDQLIIMFFSLYLSIVCLSFLLL